MENTIEKYKGVHPGKVIEEEYIKRNTSQRELAAHIGEHFQTLNAVINGRRKLTMELADKLDAVFRFEPGTLWILQAYHDVTEFQHHKLNPMSGHPDIRKTLFGDVDFDNINWGYRKEWGQKRVMARGNSDEKAEIRRFYNIDTEKQFSIAGSSKGKN